MITNNTTPSSQKENCIACNTSHLNDELACSFCGYPLKGTDQDQRSFLAIRANHILDLEEQEKKIKQGTYTLYGVSALVVIYGIILYADTTDELEKASVLITNLVLSAIYVGLGLLSRKKPKAALIAGFSIFILTTLLNVLIEPMSLAKGIIVKIVIVVALIKGIRAVTEAQKIRKEHHLE